jgi:hypothetical protein
MSASYRVTGGEIRGHQNACKVHADIMIRQGYRAKYVNPKMVDLSRPVRRLEAI